MSYVMFNVVELTEMFNQINKDIAARNEQEGLAEGEGQSVVPLWDVEYYTEQIENIYECGYELAEQAAIAMANYVAQLN